MAITRKLVEFVRSISKLIQIERENRKQMICTVDRLKLVLAKALSTGYDHFHRTRFGQSVMRGKFRIKRFHGQLSVRNSRQEAQNAACHSMTSIQNNFFQLG